MKYWKKFIQAPAIIQMIILSNSAGIVMCLLKWFEIIDIPWRWAALPIYLPFLVYMFLLFFSIILSFFIKDDDDESEEENSEDN